MARKPSPLWRNNHLQDLVRPRVLWSLTALPLLSLALSFAPWIWLAPWLDTRYPIRQGLTAEIALLLCGILLVTVAGIVFGAWLGWRANEWICLRFLGWNVDEVRRVFRESQLPSRWLKASVVSNDVDAEAASAARERLQGGMWTYVLKVGVLRWGLVMFLAVGLVPKLLQDAPLQPRVLAVQALIWLVGGMCFGLVLWSTERAKLRDRSKSGDS